jgi:tRNA (guanine-N7-)-methyltransferase
MGKDKHKRFNEMNTFKNVYQNFDFKTPELQDYRSEIVELKGVWSKDHFKNENPITLELACGKGEYTVGLSEKDPNTNFIGVDIKGARIHDGATKCLAKNQQNAAFLRTRIELLPNFFAAEEVAEMWIVFSDPFPKDRHAKHRLTSPFFLDVYRNFCKKGAIINVKTDSESLFDYTLEVLAEQKIEPIILERDIYVTGYENELLTGIQTFYEKQHIADGRKINYVQFKLH